MKIKLSSKSLHLQTLKNIFFRLNWFTFYSDKESSIKHIPKNNDPRNNVPMKDVQKKTVKRRMVQRRMFHI